MSSSDPNEYWLLKHPDTRTIIIARRPEEHGLGIISWVETTAGEATRKGSWDLGMFSSAKPGDELAKLLERFRGEGYELRAIRTPLSPTVLKLLRALDARDGGGGVGTTQMRNGWRLEGGGGNYSHHTFRALDGLGVINVGNGHTDRVYVLPVGRDLARMSRERANIPTPAGIEQQSLEMTS